MDLMDTLNELPPVIQVNQVTDSKKSIKAFHETRLHFNLTAFSKF
jgi:hypothetical protein